MCNVYCVGALGEDCDSDRDCLYGNCTSGICTAPTLQCDSSITGTVCSGHGSCTYADASGNEWDGACTIFDVFCSATCVCDEAYGGADCSLTAEELADVDSYRASLCQAILDIGDLSNPSTQYFNNIVTTLQSAFDPSEVTSENTTLLCLDALNYVGELAAEGYLGDATSSVASYLTSTLSNFVNSGNSSLSNYTEYVVAQTVANLVSSLQQAMVPGQDTVDLTSDNVRISVIRNYIGDLSNSSLSPPLTDAEAAYNVIAPTIAFSGDDVSQCDAGTYILNLM